jgi:protein ImuB
MHDGRRRVVTAAGAAAQAIGIMPGMPLANAQALVPRLGIVEAEPDADAATLTQLAVWCLRYAPLVATDGPDGICGSTQPAALTSRAARRFC